MYYVIYQKLDILIYSLSEWKMVNNKEHNHHDKPVFCEALIRHCSQQ